MLFYYAFSMQDIFQSLLCICGYRHSDMPCSESLSVSITKDFLCSFWYPPSTALSSLLRG